MRSSRSLKKGVCKVIERLATGLTTVSLTFNQSSTCFYSVLPKSHDRMGFAMRANKPIFMLLLLNSINHSNWNQHSLGSLLQKVNKLLFTMPKIKEGRRRSLLASLSLFVTNSTILMKSFPAKRNKCKLRLLNLDHIVGLQLLTGYQFLLPRHSNKRYRGHHQNIRKIRLDLRQCP